MPIKKVKGGYKIKHVKGKSKTRKAAKKRLAAIKIKQGKQR